ncbi:MAG: M1 family metallopeptidase [Polyangiales bacterium]
MARPRLALASALLAACAAAPRSPTPHHLPDTAFAVHLPRLAPMDPPAPLATGRLPALASPERYALSLTVDPRREDYRGEVAVDVTVRERTQFLVLHARSLAVSSARAVINGATIHASATTRRAVGGREADEELVLRFDGVLPAGAARVHVAFTGRFAEDLRGLFRVRAGDDWYAFSDFEPTDARRAFPCFDEPSFKVPVEVTLTAPAGMAALSNMPEREHRDATDGAVEHRFEATPPTPTYLVSFAVGPFDFFEGPREPVPVRVATVRGRSALGRVGAETAAAHLRVLADYFGRPYPYPKLDLVAVPDFLPGAMENPGLITFRDTALLLDPARASAQARHYTYGIVAHELAHQWFGNLVTMAWWDDLWLNEGFATWMGSRVMDTWRPELGERVDAVASSVWARTNDGLTTARPVRTPVTTTSQAMEAFDAMAYNKGAAVLRMLEAHVGEGPFREGVRAYLNAHAWGNATAADLIASLSTAAGRDLAPIASSFLDQAGVPMVDASVVCAPGAVARVTLRQSRFTNGRPAEGEPARWAIPVCVRYPTATATGEACALLREAEQSVALDLPAGRCPAWVHPNAGARGYYWHAVTGPALRALLAAAALTPEERLDALASLHARYEAGALPVGEWLAALARFTADRDPFVAEQAVGHLAAVEHQLVTDDTRPRFRAWLAGLLGARARALGFAPRPSDTEATRDLRRAVLMTLGMHTDDPWVRAQADAAARRYLADAASVDADVAAVALPIASRRADGERFAALLEALGRAATPQDRALVLGAMLTFEDLALVRRAYALALTDAVRAQDLRVLFGRVGPTPAHRALLLDWARENLPALRQKLGRHTRAVVGALAWRCDEASIAAGEAFVREATAGMEGVDRAIAQSGEFARRCVAVRARDAAAAGAAFARRPAG